MTFEINVKLDMGRNFFNISLSKPVFFKSGRMSAVFSDLGIRESLNDMLTMSVIVGINSAMHSFRSQVGNGSSSHDFAGDSIMIFRISISVASVKVVSGVTEKEVVIEPHLYKPGNPNSLLMVNILL